MLIKRTNFTDLFREFDTMFNGFETVVGLPFGMIRTGREEGSDSDGKWVKETYQSRDGSFTVTNFVKTNMNGSQSNEPDEIVALRSELDKSVKSQDFEKAAELRDRIKLLEGKKDEINAIKSELDRAVKEQDFEKAIELRDRLKSFSLALEEPKKKK